MKNYKFKIPIYYDTLCVIKTNNLKKVAKKFGMHFKPCAAFVFKIQKKSGRTIYYAAFDYTNPHVIAHETVHLVNLIFKDRGVYLDLENDEPQAYLTGWVFNKIFTSLKK